MTYLLKYWLNRVAEILFGRPFRKADGRMMSRHIFSRHLSVETLEDRSLPSANVLADINPGSASSNPNYLTNVNGTLFFTANDGVHGDQLWKTNGTAAGTVMVTDINPAGLGPKYLTNVNGTLFFTGSDGPDGVELWKSDGTAAGTVMVKDIKVGSGGSNPSYLTNVNGTLYFSANDGVHGYELWKSDGTAAGTVMVKDISPGSANAYPKFLTDVNGTLFFSANDGVHGYELWESNGTAAGTVMVKDINPGSTGSYPKELTDVNGTLFFSANDGVHGYELWESNGTAAGTVMVKDINLGSTGSYPQHLTDVNGTLFFSANDGVHGYELWESDGTAAGTALVKDINPGSASSYLQYPTNVNGTLFFSANDGVHGYELWESNGTAAGTALVKDINPGSASSLPQYLTNVSGTLLFAANDGVNGDELWESDVAGTMIVDPGSGAKSPNQLTEIGDTLFFAATDLTHGTELWELSLAPTVSMTSPANNSLTNNNEPTLTATASDDVSGLASVQFQYSSDGGSTWNNAGAAETTAPFSYTFTSPLADGSYEARAIAIDNSNFSTTSAVVSFTIDTVAPTVSLTAPANNSDTNNNKPALTATASDNVGGSGLASVQLQYSSNGGGAWINAGAAQTSGPFSYLFPAALADGSYEARAIAVDKAGNSTTSTVVSFIIDTIAPTVSMTSPANNSYTLNSEPTLVAMASDNTGGSGLASVQLQYSNGGGTWTNVGPAQTSGPFTYTFLSPLADGTYEARAIAIDNAANSTTSAAVTFTVESVAPTSSVNALPPTTTTTSFTVSWSGADYAGGSGIASFSVYVSMDGGAFQPFVTQTAATNATFTGVSGHTYGFYSVATDMSGFVQPAPTSAQATTSILTNITNPLATNYETSVTVNVANLIPSPSGPVAYGTTFLDPLLALKQKYGLTTPDLEQYINVRGEGEKYLVSSNGSNPANGGYYVLMPNGNLYAWDGVSLPTTVSQTPIATVGAAVYNNPALLTSNTGVPIVSVDNPLYDLKIQLGLVTPVVAFNARGGNEKYLLSSNGSNGAFGGYYELLPNDTLVAYSGSPFAGGTLVANLSAYGNVYANPSLLYAAEPTTAVGVTTSVLGNLLTLTPTAGFDRSVTATVTASDDGTPVSQSFTFTVSDTAPTAPPVNPQSTSHSDFVTPFTLSATGSAAATLTYSSTVAGYNPLYDIKTEFGLTQADITPAFNARGGGEKYFQSTNGSNFIHGGYYLLLPTGILYAWDGVSLLTTAVPANQVADPGTAAYANTSLLYGAQLPTALTVFSNQGILYDIQEQFGLTQPDITSAFNARGGNEKYFQSANGSNFVHGGYYVLMPDGLLYTWDGNSLATTVLTTPVANLGSEGVYADTALLYDAQPAVVGDSLYAVKEEFGIDTADIASAFNARGFGEKYFKSSNGSNAANGGYYVLYTNNDLYAWDGTSIPTTIAQPPVAQFGATDVYDNPYLLYSDVGQTPAVSPNINSAGEVTITQSPYYTGTARVNATVSDGAEMTTQRFLYTSTNAAPTVQAVSPVTVTLNATVPTVNLVASDADSDPLTYAVSVSTDNPLYDLKAEFGLTKPDLTSAFDARGEDEKYFQSTNGSNAVNGGYYVLMPTGFLYAWNGVSLLGTVTLANQVGDPGTAAYANTALLYKAQPPASPTVQVNRGPLYDIREEFGLTQPDIDSAFNARGHFEKYFQSTSGSNAANGGYYVLMPTGNLYAWDGISLATTTAGPVVANLSSYGVYAQPSLLYDALPAFVGDPLFAAKDQFGLTNPDITAAFNARFEDEKYFQSTNGSNAANGGFYVLMPTGNLYTWDGALSTTVVPTNQVATLGVAAYNDTALLYDSTGLVPSVTATVNASGQITIVPNSAFVGTVQINAVVSDGLVNTTQSFSFTVTDPAPVLPAISAVSVSTGTGSKSIALGASSANANNTLQFAAAIAGYNPLYALKTQFGLNTPDIASMFNAGGQQEKYFKSSNGSNAANGGLYVLLSTGKLYAYDGFSLATTLATIPTLQVSTLGAAVYANTALLYNAVQPAAPAIVAAFPNTTGGGTLQLTWPTGYTGTFMTTVFVGDGALETQQSFLVTVT